MWSLGILIFEMLVGRTPFMDEDITTLYGAVLTYAKDRKLSFPWFFNSEAKAVIEALLAPDPHDRPKPVALQRHPFFAPIDFVQLEARVVNAPYKPMIQHALDTSNFEELDEDDEDDDEEEVAHRRTNSFINRLPSTAQFPGFLHCDGWDGPSGC